MDPDPGTVISTFEALVSARRSCRAFLPQPLPRETIIRLLELAQKAQSDCNIQPWRVDVVSGNLLERLRTEMHHAAASGLKPVYDLAPIEDYYSVYLDRRRACGWGLYGALAIAQGDREARRLQALENFNLFGAPHLAIVSAPKRLGGRALIDCGAYLAHFTLGAEAMNVASVPQAAIALRCDILRSRIDIPVENQILFGIAFGLVDPDHLANSFKSGRETIEKVVLFHE